MHSVVLSEKGQLVIPKRLRNKFGLARGTKLVIFEENDRLVLEVLDSVVEKLKKAENLSKNAGQPLGTGEGAVLANNNDKLRERREAREVT